MGLQHLAHLIRNLSAVKITGAAPSCSTPSTPSENGDNNRFKLLRLPTLAPRPTVSFVSDGSETDDTDATNETDLQEFLMDCFDGGFDPSQPQEIGAADLWL